MIYNANIPTIVKKTETFPLANISLKPAKTLLKSIGAGAVIRPPPNDVKWVHKQCVLLISVFGPTCEIN